MATRAQVRELVDAGQSYESAARSLGIAPGQAFMIGTGLPADGSGAFGIPAAQALGGPLPPSTQALVNPPRESPTRKESVIRWVQDRAARELSGGEK
jgi:hypothetical protein